MVRGIAHRPVDGATMIEAQRCDVAPNRGLIVENRKPGKREVTLLSLEAWNDVGRELGATLPWFFRRANFLLSGLDLGETLGRVLRIGSVRVFVHGETKPCGIMDQQHAGLRSALALQLRGGVYGQVLAGGTVHVGDPVSIE